MDTIIKYILTFFEALPIVLAIVGLVLSALSFTTIAARFRPIVAMMAVTLMVLIFAQTSWAVAFLVYSDIVGAWWADRLWAIFNTLVCVISILLVNLVTTESKR